jgi:hypothetical protein
MIGFIRLFQTLFIEKKLTKKYCLNPFKILLTIYFYLKKNNFNYITYILKNNVCNYINFSQYRFKYHELFKESKFF